MVEHIADLLDVCDLFAITLPDHLIEPRIKALHGQFEALAEPIDLVTVQAVVVPNPVNESVGTLGRPLECDHGILGLAGHCPPPNSGADGVGHERARAKAAARGSN